MKFKIIKYAYTVGINDLLIAAGKRFKRCLNKPYLVYFSVTYRCNAKCVTCMRWQNTDDSDELSLKECKEIISQLKSWTGCCNISFTGGEPFVKEGMCELIRQASDLGLCTNVSTNGVIFDKIHCDEILRSGVDSIIFSLNSIEPDLHNYYKGVDGLHQTIVSAIRYLKSKKTSPRVGVLMLITKDTYRYLDDFVRWTRQLQVDSVDFQPILDIHPPALQYSSPLSESLHILPLAQIDDFVEFDRQIDLLIQRKKEGLPIVMPISQLHRLKIFFRDIKQMTPTDPCTVGFRNLYLTHNGQVQLCPWYEPIGDIRHNSISEIWSSEKAKQQRLQMLKCQKPCLAGCMRKYGFSEKLKHFFLFAKSNRSGLRKASMRQNAGR